MSYLVIARKFRPQTFESVAGQEHISTALANAIVRGRVPHALLFTGPRGVGKTTTARIFAKALNCTGRTIPEGIGSTDGVEARKLVEPCGDCSNCKEIAKSSSISVWEIDGASNNSVDNVRELIDSLHSLPPPNSRYKIYIIDEVHMLSTAAFNALLKSLEEPPPNTIFVFATTEPHKIPETVISRCQRHDFRRVTADTIASLLADIAQVEGVKIAQNVCDFIAQKANGGVRDAQSMLDRLFAFGEDEIDLAKAQRVFGVVDRSYFIELSEAVLKGETSQCFSLVDKAFSQSIDLRSFVGDFITHWRAVLLLSLTQARKGDTSKVAERLLDLTSKERELLQKQLKDTSSFDVQRLFDIAEKTANTALQSTFPRYVLEAGIAKMATLPSLRPLPEILSQLGGGGSSRSVSASVHAQASSEKPRAFSSESKPVREQTTQPVAGTNLQMRDTGTELSVAALPSAPAELSSNFNPSWLDFVSHAKGRSEHVLAAFLRRVSPRIFSLGKLELEASAFDISSLKEKGTLEGLKSCLFSYSGEHTWEISFINRQVDEIPQDKKESEAKEPTLIQRSAAPNGSATDTNRDPMPGSIAADEVQKKNQRTDKVETEARNSALVKDALSIFEGSTVERVIVLDNQRR